MNGGDNALDHHEAGDQVSGHQELGSGTRGSADPSEPSGTVPDYQGCSESGQGSAELQDRCDQCGGTAGWYSTPRPSRQRPPALAIPEGDIKAAAVERQDAPLEGRVPDRWRSGHEGGTECRTSDLPAETRRMFISYQVECIIKDVLEARLRKVRYDPDECGHVTKEICSLIREKTKEFEFDRYKLVTQVLLGQDSDQSVQIATRCLWNQDTDNFAAATFRNEWIFAVAIVYGLYLD